MDPVFLFALFTSVSIVALIILLAIRGLKGSNDSNEDYSDEPRINRRSARETSSSSLRHRNRNSQELIENESDNENMDYNDDYNDELKDFPFKGKIGVKKQRKLEMKAEKKLIRERELQEREERKRLMEEREKQQKLEEERIAQEEKAKEEAERLEKERKEREEQELYLQLKQSFTVDEEGFDGDDNEEESQTKLQKFIDYIKEKKVVHMDELAGNFNMKTPEVVQRIQDLLEQQLLVGVIDDRGKFIYITNNELESVARFIKQRGRVSLTELAENSNNLVKLIPIDPVN